LGIKYFYQAIFKATPEEDNAESSRRKLAMFLRENLHWLRFQNLIKEALPNVLD